MKNKNQNSIVKEPEGVDFLVQSTPWTPQERAEFSAFLRARKEKKRLESLDKAH
jgi:hypothetical protein